MAYDSAALEALGIVPGGGGTYVDRAGNPVDPSTLGDAVKQKMQGYDPNNVAVDQYGDPKAGWQMLGTIQGGGVPMPYYYNASTGQTIGHDGSQYGNGTLQEVLQGVGNSNAEVSNRAAQSAAGRSGWDEPDNLMSKALNTYIAMLTGNAVGSASGLTADSLTGMTGASSAPGALTGSAASAFRSGAGSFIGSGGNLSSALSGAAMGGLNNAGSSLFGSAGTGGFGGAQGGGSGGGIGDGMDGFDDFTGGWNGGGGYSYNPDLGDQQMVGNYNLGGSSGSVYDPDLADKEMAGNGTLATGYQKLLSLGISPGAAFGLAKALAGGSGGGGGGGNNGGLFGLGTGAGSTGGQLGALLAAGLGYNASNNQTAAYQQLAQQYAGYGAPYRQQLSDLMANPSSFLSSDQVQKPVQMGSDMLARSLSMQGNPATSGNALQQLQNYSTNQLYSQLQGKENQLGQLGGIANFNQAAPTAASSAIQSSGNASNAIGAGLNNIFNPTQSLAQQLAAFSGGAQ